MISLTFHSNFERKRASRFLVKYQVPSKEWSITNYMPIIEVTTSIFPRVKRIFDRDNIKYIIEE